MHRCLKIAVSMCYSVHMLGNNLKKKKVFLYLLFINSVFYV